MDTWSTKIIVQPGSASLLLARAKLTVLEGPDRGLELHSEQPVVRVGSGAECELRLHDPAVSWRHLELRATEGGYQLRDLGSTNGTFLDEVRLREASITGPVVLRLGTTRLRVAPSGEELAIPLSPRTGFGQLLGESVAMRQLFATLERAAPTELTILLEGESGTGKEVAAQAIHAASARADGPLVVVDCAAIPAGLIESELFGHERGAFTGASEARRGALEEANGGTLFLDEIGELPLELQPRLLRFLETQQVRRVGGSRVTQVSTRVLAATHRNLVAAVEEGSFRADLYYRLAVVRVELPPLRERRDDIPLLAHHFAERLVRDPREVLSEEVLAMLRAHDWPGNLRELRNMVERLLVTPEQALADLQRPARLDPLDASALAPFVDLPFHEAKARWQEIFERHFLAAQLDRSDGVIARAALRCGLARPSFHRMMRRHGLRGG